MEDLEKPYVLFVREPPLTPHYKPVEKKTPNAWPHTPPNVFYNVELSPSEEDLTHEVPAQPPLKPQGSAACCWDRALRKPYRVGCVAVVFFCLLLTALLLYVNLKPVPDGVRAYGNNPNCDPKTLLGRYQYMPPSTNESVECFDLLAQVYGNDCLWADNCQWYDWPSAVFMFNLKMGRLVDAKRDEMSVVLSMVDPSYDYWITDGDRPACLNNGTAESECTGKKKILCISWSAHT